MSIEKLTEVTVAFNGKPVTFFIKLPHNGEPYMSKDVFEVFTQWLGQQGSVILAIGEDERRRKEKIYLPYDKSE